MEQYISKSTLVAEIERLAEVQPTNEFQPKEQNKIDWLSGKMFAINSLRVFSDTLEVKEVDLKEYYHKFLQKEWFENPHVRTVSEMMAFTAKHFFELGMAAGNKAQKGENV